MLEFSPPINEKKVFNNFSMFEKTEIIKLNIRGNPNNKDFSSKVGKTLGIILPSEVGNVVSKEDISVITTGPNEWLVVSNRNIEKNNQR